MVSCITSVIVYSLYDQFVESHLLKTRLISAVLTKSPNLIFGCCLTLRSWRFEDTSFAFVCLLDWMGVIYVELWIVLLYCLTTDDNSDNQSAFPFSNTGFSNELRTVRITCSAILGPLSVNLE